MTWEKQRRSRLAIEPGGVWVRVPIKTVSLLFLNYIIWKTRRHVSRSSDWRTTRLAGVMGYGVGAQKRRFLQDKHPQNSVPSESTQNSVQDPKFWTLGMKASTVGYIGYADDTYPSYGDLPNISPRYDIHLFSTAPSESTRKTGLVRCLQHVQM